MCLKVRCALTLLTSMLLRATVHVFTYSHCIATSAASQNQVQTWHFGGHWLVASVLQVQGRSLSAAGAAALTGESDLSETGLLLAQVLGQQGSIFDRDVCSTRFCRGFVRTGERVRHHRHRIDVYRGLCVQRCNFCLLYTSPSPRDGLLSRMPSSA